MDFEPVEIAHDEQGRVLERLAVVEQLLVGSRQVRSLALVLPSEMVLLPDVGEPVAAGSLLGALLERIMLIGRVVVRSWVSEHPAQVDEVLLGRGALGTRAARPLGRELRRRHRVTLAVAASK